MVQRNSFTLFTALALLGLLSLAFAHGHDSHVGDSTDMAMSGGAAHMAFASNGTMKPTALVRSSYFSHSEFSGLMLAHIAFMTIAWFFILPIGEHHHSES